ncbi:hypothetical protein [Methylomonas methanica]|uniref:hypothetical protein n=1 Tax=Methylomonas methanica TaxID=421 RepID=UPI00130545E3|nr:hypothetical protein [Methylomonas methanica]
MYTVSKGEGLFDIFGFLFDLLGLVLKWSKGQTFLFSPFQQWGLSQWGWLAIGIFAIWIIWLLHRR